MLTPFFYPLDLHVGLSLDPLCELLNNGAKMHQFCHHMKSDEILRLKHCIDALTSCGSLCTPCMEKKKSPCSCGSIAYCSKRCQKAHWTAHKGQHWNSNNTTAMAATMSEHIERFAHENHFEMSDPFNRVVLHQFLSKN